MLPCTVINLRYNTSRKFGECRNLLFDAGTTTYLARVLQDIAASKATRVCETRALKGLVTCVCFTEEEGDDAKIRCHRCFQCMEI